MPRWRLGLFARLLRLLEFDHRDLALLLNDRLRRLLHDAFGRKNTSHDHSIQPHGDVLLFDEFGLHFPCNGILQLLAGRGIGRQLEQRILLDLFSYERAEGFLGIVMIPIRAVFR